MSKKALQRISNELKRLKRNNIVLALEFCERCLNRLVGVIRQMYINYKLIKMLCRI